MRGRGRWFGLVLALLSLLWGGAAEAQPTADPAPVPAPAPGSPPSPGRPPSQAVSPGSTQAGATLRYCSDEGAVLSARDLFLRTWDWRPLKPGYQGLDEFVVRREHGAGAARAATYIELQNDYIERQLPSGVRMADLTFIAAANPVGEVTRPEQPRYPSAAGVRVTTIPAAGNRSDVTRMRIDTPALAAGLHWQGWRYVIAFCQTKNDQLVGFATFEIELRASWIGWVLKIGILMVFWAAAAWIAHSLHRPTLTRLWQAGVPAPTGDPPAAWRLRRVVNPVFVAQDAAGYGSLAKTQLLVFTGVVVAIVAQAWFATDTLPDFSTTVLSLLGITSAGTLLARAVTGGSISSANRAFLVGRRVIPINPREPRLADLIGTEGEIDTTKLQAVCFSIYVMAALFVVDPVDIATFAVPEQFLYLMGLSQGVYIAGRAFTPEAVKRLNEDLDRLRKAERDWLGAPATETPEQRQARIDQALRDFETAREAAAVSLDATSEGSEQASRLRLMRPGQPFDPAEARPEGRG